MSFSVHNTTPLLDFVVLDDLHVFVPYSPISHFFLFPTCPIEYSPFVFCKVFI